MPLGAPTAASLKTIDTGKVTSNSGSIGIGGVSHKAPAATAPAPTQAPAATKPVPTLNIAPPAFLDFQPPRYVDEPDEMIWWSERSGWGHYYLYGRDGKLKNPIDLQKAFDPTYLRETDKALVVTRRCTDMR